MITTHILDTSIGRPASGVTVLLEIQKEEANWALLGKGETDADGRVREIVPKDHVITAGVYRLTFDTASYFASRKVESFYPEVSVIFTVREASQHYHVPLLLNPYGYSTYRGS